MEFVLSNAQMRRADAYTIENLGICGGLLMKRAGVAIADEVEKAAKRLNVTEITVVCGTGNNGGDGYVCANELLSRGCNVKIYAAEGNLSADCRREKENNKCPYSSHITGSIVVDCLFGTGLDRKIEGQFAQIINEINSSNAYVISADIPSGINGDNGNICGVAVKADLTVAIAEYKLGMFLGDGIDYCGKVIKKDIGISLPADDYAKIYSEEDIKKFYPQRVKNSHKGTYGKAELIAGSRKYSGAASLSVQAALQSGCGLVSLLSEDYVKKLLAPRLPQAIYADETDLTAEAMAIGMGCGNSAGLYEKLKFILENYEGKLLIDADGLNALSEYGLQILKNKKCKVLLTPHAKEFSRLTGFKLSQIFSDPVTICRNFANEYGITLLLKGAASIICDGTQTAVNVRGNTALSKGGSGDMLAGFACGLLARGLSVFDAAVCASFTLGLSAEISAEEKTEYCATARDILRNLYLSVKRLTK